MISWVSDMSLRVQKLSNGTRNKYYDVRKKTLSSILLICYMTKTKGDNVVINRCIKKRIVKKYLSIRNKYICFYLMTDIQHSMYRLLPSRPPRF